MCLVLRLLLQYPNVFGKIFFHQFAWAIKKLVQFGAISPEEVLYLYAFSLGYSMAQISEITGMSMFFVYNRIIRVLKRIQFLVGGAFYDEYFVYVLSEYASYDTILEGLKSSVSKRRKLWYYDVYTGTGSKVIQHVSPKDW